MSISVLLAGIAGTLAMTLFIEIFCIAFKKPFHVVRVLAHVLQFNPSPKKHSLIMHAIATIVHYTIGIIFSYGFKLCLQHELLQASWAHALIYGCIAGLVGILGWRIVFALHPSPPKLNLLQYLTLIWAGHLVFAGGQFFTFSHL